MLLVISEWSIPVLLLLILGAGLVRKVPMYEVFVQGAFEGIKTTVKLTPYILAIFVAVGIFRSSGALNILISLLHPLLTLFKIPPELLTLGFLKPLSGSATLGITAELLQKYGPDSLVGLTASLAQSSSETTLYTLSLYLGAVNIKDSRHLVGIGLCSEFIAFLLAILTGVLIAKL